ncbi:MAG TPA: hypothetical protein VF337_00215 [Candidatus Limnocylindrales bacterium]
MSDQREPARPDSPPRLEDDLDLVPIRRRGESHLLAAISAAAVVAIAIAVVKPWGQSELPRTPSPSPSPHAEIARASTRSVAPTVSAAPSTTGDGLDTVVTYRFLFGPGASSDGVTFLCTYDLSAMPSIGSQAGLAADPSAIYIVSSDPESGALTGTGLPLCASGGQPVSGSVLPSPSAT